VMGVYLLPPLSNTPDLQGHKDTFPNPQGIGQLDPV